MRNINHIFVTPTKFIQIYCWYRLQNC